MKDLHTFGELIRENKIVIPKIQRDYVQGSNAQQEKRDDFLAVLLDHLVSDKEYHLDFIYGTGGTDQGEFLPLDGQQRLTTIFLIHWVLSQRSGIRDIEVKDYFSMQQAYGCKRGQGIQVQPGFPLLSRFRKTPLSDIFL